MDNFNQEKEWRVFLIQEIKDLKTEVKLMRLDIHRAEIVTTTLKTKIALIGSMFGTFFGALSSILITYIKGE